MCRDGSYPLLGGHPGRSRAAPAVRLEPLMGRRVVVPNRNCTRAGTDGTAVLCAINTILLLRKVIKCFGKCGNYQN